MSYEGFWLFPCKLYFNKTITTYLLNLLKDSSEKNLFFRHKHNIKGENQIENTRANRRTLMQFLAHPDLQDRLDQTILCFCADDSGCLL